jgi:ring-1,2-phenylacetyl-CoA epoxidase subunit PaaD
LEKNITLFCGHLAVPGDYCNYDYCRYFYFINSLLFCRTEQSRSAILTFKMLSKEHIFSLISQIPDPEIPVITIEELGVIRDVTVNGEDVDIKITPTYSGCPAMKQMEDDIKSVLLKNGIKNLKITTVYAPPWTSDWLSAEAKEKLRAYGIATPEHSTQDKSWLSGKTKTVTCPRCKSQHTKLISQFGSTACKALYQCEDCLEPFDYFKCI